MKKVLSVVLVLMLAAALVLPGARTAVAAAGSFTIVSDETVMVTKINGTPVSQPAVLAWEPYEDATPSAWDLQLDRAFPVEADWIWESYRTTRPMEGDVVYFERTFNVPGVPTGGTLYITCDNGYEAWLNGTMVATAQLAPGWETSSLKQEYVDYNNWQSVESADVSSYLVPGDNVLLIKAANEYMNYPDDPPNGGVGTTYANPAGLIFQMDVEYSDFGSTRTWGYWKTHSTCGSAPRDATWDLLLPDAEGTTFFLSQQDYCEVLDTSTAGGAAYYQLAHQYIAAQLNALNGAWMRDDVKRAFDAATLLFETYTPGQITAAKKGNKGLWAEFNSLAAILDSYNNGNMGTPHAG